MAVDEDGTGTTAPLTTAILCAGEAEVIAQHAQQRATCVGIGRTDRPIDMKFLDSSHVESPPIRSGRDGRRGEERQRAECNESEGRGGMRIA
jgi:hypothetical protein